VTTSSSPSPPARPAPTPSAPASACCASRTRSAGGGTRSSTKYAQATPCGPSPVVIGWAYASWPAGTTWPRATPSIRGNAWWCGPSPTVT